MSSSPESSQADGPLSAGRRVDVVGAGGRQVLGAMPVQGPDGRIRSVTVDALSPVDQAIDLRAGDRIGKYRLIDRIAIGGMGEVWKALDERLNRPVALKLLLRQTTRALSRFAREAQVVAGLDHDHIARIYEFSANPAFIALQLIPGQPIDGSGPLSIYALQQAALAIHHAHQRGVLHRDVKPGNILVDKKGHATVVDFGLALPLHNRGDRRAVTMSGEILGTPAFMAPEQARGETDMVTVRTDVYGLGATLHAMLRGGEPPFDGATAFDVIDSVLEDEPPPTGGNRDLETIALKAMAKNPERRYESANAFAADLGRYLHHEPIEARRPSFGYLVYSSIRRRPAIWGLSATLSTVLVVGATLWIQQLQAGNESERRYLAEERARLQEQREAEQARFELLKRTLELQESEDLIAASRKGLASEKAERLRLQELQRLVDSVRLRLREYEDQLARRLPAAVVAEVRDGIGALLSELTQARDNLGEEAVLWLLSGDAQALLLADTAALEAYGRGLQQVVDGGNAAQPEVVSRCRLGRARVLLRTSLIGAVAHRQLLQTEPGPAFPKARQIISQDLVSIGALPYGDYDHRLLSLWQRFVATATADREATMGLLAEVDDLAAQGGRRSESLLVLQGILRDHLGDLSGAVESYERSIDRYHLQPQTLLLQAIAKWRLGDLLETVADADTAIETDPQPSPLLFLVRGLAAEALGRYRVADEDLSAATRGLPKEPLAWYYKGRYHAGRGKLAAAAEDFAAGLQAAAQAEGFDRPHLLWHGLAAVFADAGLPQAAQRAWAQPPGRRHPQAQLQIAASLRRGGDSPAALEVLSALLQDAEGLSDTDGLAAQLARIEILHELGRERQAYAVIDAALPQAARPAPLLLARARVRLQRQDIDGAVVDLDAALAAALQAQSAEPADAANQRDLVEVLLDRSRLLMDQGEFDTAWAEARQAERLADTMQLPQVFVQHSRLHAAALDRAAQRQARDRAAGLWQQAARLAERRFDWHEARRIVETANRALGRSPILDEIAADIAAKQAAVQEQVRALVDRLPWGREDKGVADGASRPRPASTGLVR